MICYDRIVHLLDHAIRDALGFGIDCLGDPNLRDLCDTDAGVDWLSAIELAKECVRCGIGSDLKTMYAVGAGLARAGAIGPVTRYQYAREFVWCQPAQAILLKLDDIAACLS